MLYNIGMETNNTTNQTTSTDNVVISRAQYEELMALNKKLQEQNQSLQNQLIHLSQIVELFRRDKYGSKSEKITPEMRAGVDSLFDEPELIHSIEEDKAAKAAEEAETVTVKEHERVKKSKTSIWDKLPEGTEEIVEEHRLEEGATCPKCGAELEVIGKKEVKSLVLIPAQYKVKIDVYYTYACKKCPDNGNNVTVVETPRVPQVIPGSFASPEAIAHLMTQKYAMGVPLYRQAIEYHRQGLDLSRQTISNWLLESAELWLKPLYNRLHEKLLEEDVLHADETTVQVLHEEGRSPQSKSYMWLFRTSGCAEHPIVLYKYEPSRSQSCAQEFLKGFKGYLHSDGYEAYHNLGETVTNVGCLVHARRYFNDALETSSKGENQIAAKAMGYFTRIFKLEKKFEKLEGSDPYKTRYEKRLKEEKPLLDELFAWVEKLNVMPKSTLGKAVVYLLNQKRYLYNYLLDGRLEASNNRAERSIKPFVIARKNFLFANAADGAEGSSMIFSMIETAKENQLDPYRYLTYVLRTAPRLEQTDANWMEPLLPENVPVECKANYRSK